ncbi:hypothetical protein DP129_04890 [Clostridium tetani]|nr:hypothetical protein DP129_04890 [Clostridium tetani]
MDIIMMIIKSHIKQRNRSILILIQLVIASFSISIGLGLFDSNIFHISKVKSIFPSNSIYINASTSLGPLSESEKSRLFNLYKHIKNDSRVSYIGSYGTGYIKSDSSDKPDERYKEIKVIAIDSDLVSIFNNLKGMEIKINNENNDSSIPVLVGKDIGKIIPLGSKKVIKINSSPEEYSVNVEGIIKKDTFFIGGSIGSTISDGIEEVANKLIVILPKNEKILIKDNLLIKLKNDSDKDKFILDVKQALDTQNMNGFVHDINYEIKDYMSRNKVPIIVSIGLSLLLLILSSFGLVGVILSSIIRRKTEFGIRYSIGATPKNIMQLIVGEILFLFLLGDLIGISLAFALSMAVDGINIGFITISASTMTMLIFCFLSSLIPAIKIIRTEPIELINMRGN